MNNPQPPRKRQSIDPLVRKRPAQIDLRDQGTTRVGTVSRYVTRLEPVRRKAANVLDLRPVATILTSPKPSRARVAPRPQPLAKPAVAAVKSKRTRLLDSLQSSLIVVAALTMAFNVTAGQVFIGLYGLVVLAKRLDSRGPFIVAVIMLITIPIFQLINLSGFSENAAIYAYELMVIGVVEAIAETWREGRAKSPDSLP